mgnify:CR=1 FL=1
MGEDVDQLFLEFLDEEDEIENAFDSTLNEVCNLLRLFDISV